MKNILLALVFTVALFSCSKDSDNRGTDTPGNTAPVFKFTANGKAYEWSYAYQPSATKSVGLVKSSSGEYSLSALSDDEYLHLGIPAKLLLEKTYTYSQGSAAVNGFTEAKLIGIDADNTYTTANAGDAITVEVTQINDELASGTFNAQLSVPGSPAKKLTITNGVFTNIKVLE